MIRTMSPGERAQFAGIERLEPCRLVERQISCADDHALALAESFGVLVELQHVAGQIVHVVGPLRLP